MLLHLNLVYNGSTIIRTICYMDLHFEINKLSSVPLYAQLKESIKWSILEGIYDEGQQLPTEELLCNLYSVSRPVVRRAYQALIDEGIVERHQGRGTFVKRNLVLSNLLFRDDYEEYLKELNLTSSSRLIMIDVVSRFDIPDLIDEDYDEFYNLKRVRYANKIPIMYENFFFPKDRFPDLENELTEDMAFDKYIEEKFEGQEIKVMMQINASAADDFNQVLFELEKGDAMFKLDIYKRHDDNKLCCHKISYFPGNRHRLDMRAD